MNTNINSHANMKGRVRRRVGTRGARVPPSSLRPARRCAVFILRHVHVHVNARHPLLLSRVPGSPGSSLLALALALSLLLLFHIFASRTVCVRYVSRRYSVVSLHFSRLSPTPALSLRSTSNTGSATTSSPSQVLSVYLDSCVPYPMELGVRLVLPGCKDTIASLAMQLNIRRSAARAPPDHDPLRR
ncbi:hypothetical protein L226DRAFT_175911 [Lentinus tigrinus ALCF2SS1-7]|uniref:Uncharacterized protein n=1 Tax=Lentinus tigrinus ALCF2SS1-6 TaxID=1328759 RepID=A0A5C2RZ97_9APHY|nr:hypothetical protein L227DRAFT_258115 [Lentinus tigrinus ALCF2SS1-6]RPD71456.1 hypothetical protein L226DRAFT_175911 [Lentinus tigrinus ALCF2SS1-7]